MYIFLTCIIYLFITYFLIVMKKKVKMHADSCFHHVGLKVWSLEKGLQSLLYKNTKHGEVPSNSAGMHTLTRNKQKEAVIRKLWAEISKDCNRLQAGVKTH